MIEAKKEDAKIKTSVKWKYCEYVPLRYLLRAYHCMTLWRMYNSMLINEE